MTHKNFLSTSDKPCPKCGVKQWWLLDDNAHVLAKNSKSLLLLSYCKNCGTYFKQEKKLTELARSGKLKQTQQKELTKWQLFSQDCLASGKSLKEASRLWWHEWQTYKKFPTSLKELTEGTGDAK